MTQNVSRDQVVDHGDFLDTNNIGAGERRRLDGADIADKAEFTVASNCK
jgi:hypothetical protein